MAELGESERAGGRMPNGPTSEERDSQFGYGRTQPEFSLGERMATIESAQRKDEEHRIEIGNLEEKLRKSELGNVRTEMGTKDTAQKEAITKAETAASERAAALATELRQFTDQAQTRFGALERGGAGLSGEKAGGQEFELRRRAEQAAQNARYMLYVGLISLIFLFANGNVKLK